MIHNDECKIVSSTEQQINEKIILKLLAHRATRATHAIVFNNNNYKLEKTVMQKLDNSS